MGSNKNPHTIRKYIPIIVVRMRLIHPVYNAYFAFSGFSINVPLPPLKGVLVVRKSKPLLKSKYSLNVFTLI